MSGMTNKEALEIAQKGMRLTMARRNPFAKKEDIWKEYNHFIDSLSQQTFDNNITHLIQMLNYGEKSCRECATGEEQVEVNIKRYPRLAFYRAALLEYIRGFRKEYGLAE